MLRPTVLVVDDDEDNVQILEAALESSGFDVRMARSCAEARDLLAAAPVDALVTDFALGDGDALELMAALGARRPRVAVLVTGYGSPEDQERSRAAGFDAHLVKPIALDDLEAVLRRGLEREQVGRPPSEPPGTV
jgi:CheY-like chemotaxis protein